MVNIFAGGPQVSEKLEDSIDKENDENYKKIELDGAGIYGKFEENPKDKKTLGDEEKEKIKKHKEELSKTTRNSNNFREDINQLSKNNELKEFNFEVKDNNFEEEVLNKIAENYLKTKLPNGEYDPKKDFSKAIIETANKINNEVANIPKNTETYTVAMKNINSNDLKKQLEAIDTLYILAYNHEGALGKTTFDKFKRKKQKQLIEDYQKVNKEIEQLTKQKATDLEQQKKLQELQKQKESIEKQAQEIDAGDIFNAGKIDKNSEQSEKEKSSN